MPSGQKIAKEKQYKWKPAGEPCKFMWINKNLLNIAEDTYQRKAVSRAKVLDIAKNWDWMLIGAIAVALREDGTYWVTEGAHRTRGSWLRGDITEMPCMVRKISTIEQEAKAFYDANLRRCNVSAFHKWRAALVYGDPSAKKAADMLEKHGLEAKESGRADNTFGAIATLMWLVKESDDAERIFDECVYVCEGKPPTNNIIRGFSLINRHGLVLDKKALDNLKKHGADVIQNQTARYAHLAGKGGEKVFAQAILDLANKNRRSSTRLKLKD